MIQPQRAEALDQLFAQVARGELSPQEAVERFYSTEDTLRIDCGRADRCGFPEAVWSPGKSDSEIRAAVRTLLDRTGRALITRLSESQADALKDEFSETQLRWYARAGLLALGELQTATPPEVAILSAGTSDAAVVQEIEGACEFAGIGCEAWFDVGVAGIHRVLETRSEWTRHDVIIVVAGMDGALPSVVAGLTHRPVIAVPTSVGYGAAFDGLAALLTMLNACAPGVAVVNIDNGFGAAALAVRMLRRGE